MLIHIYLQCSVLNIYWIIRTQSCVSELLLLSVVGNIRLLCTLCHTIIQCTCRMNPNSITESKFLHMKQYKHNTYRNLKFDKIQDSFRLMISDITFTTMCSWHSFTTICTLYNMIIHVRQTKQTKNIVSHRNLPFNVTAIYLASTVEIW